MLGRLLFAVGVFILVGLACLLLGTLLASLGIAILAALGAFLERWAWVIAFAFAILSFASGTTWTTLRTRI
jgi:hypothetical protein